MRKSILFLATALTLSTAVVHGQNWPQWRGPNFNGSAGDRGSRSPGGLPSTFSRTEKVKWTATMPGAAAATPIIWEDKVFVSSTDADAKTLVAMGIDRRSGKVLWKEVVGSGLSQDNKSNYASASPATDGEVVIFFYGNGDLAAFDLNGKKLWARNVQKDYGSFAFLWTFSTSPLLHDGRLYIQVLQRNEAVGEHGTKGGPNPSYLLALNPKTGKELFKALRPAEARGESLESFTSPIPFAHAGRKEILVSGGDDITGHDPESGKELWRWGTWNPGRISHWRLVPSPVAGDGVILVCAPKGSPVYAVKAGGKGKLDEKWIAWKSEERSPVSSDVSTPLFYENHFFILNSDKKSISKVEPASGKVIWTGELGSRAKLEASPTAGDDKIYVMSHRGDVYVVGTGDTYQLIQSTPFGDDEDRDLRSSVAIAQGDLFIRTGSKLYCIGEERGAGQ